MKKKTKAILSLAIAASIAVGVAGCSAKDENSDEQTVSSSQEQTVTDESGNTVTAESASSTTVNTESTTTTKKSKKAKKVKETSTKPYYVTNINGKKITTTVAYEKVTNKKGETVTDKKGNPVTKKVTTTAPTTKKGQTTTKHYEGTTTYTTKASNGVIELPDVPEDDYVLSASLAFDNLQSNYPEKWINYYYDYDPNNNGDYAYFAVFTNPDKHTITSVITVDLRTGAANERNLKTGKVTSIKVL